MQLSAGAVLAAGGLAEMQTGEGKTLVTVLPAAAAALAGRRVHVATTNSYLAERDHAEVAAAFALLGLTTALLPEESDPAAKRAAYAADVVYGTGYEFGFDFLRDELARREAPEPTLGQSWIATLRDAPPAAADPVQPPLDATVVDEVDSVLIDEANTPLVIGTADAGPVSPRVYELAAAAAAALRPDADFTADAAAGRLELTDAGRRRVDGDLRPPAGTPLRRPWRISVQNALRAAHLLRRDADYVVREDAVALVDQNTGRVFAERKWRDGLHQAVELAEGVPLTAENRTVARVSRQRMTLRYESATGLTGTASDAAAEFRRFFGLRVVPIPLNRPSRRRYLSPRAFAGEAAKLAAVAADASAAREAGRPVLIGTRTIGQSRAVSAALEEAGVPHRLLNGVQDAAEADLVAGAGESGVVTVATNMAGRGTDIRLTAEAEAAGGLHVIGTEFHRSRRVDRQLAGRAARQGQPGSCRFYASAEDDLLRACGGRLAARWAGTASRGEVRRVDAAAIRRAQTRAEAEDFARRQALVRQELWTDRVLRTLVGREAA